MLVGQGVRSERAADVRVVRIARRGAAKMEKPNIAMGTIIVNNDHADPVWYVPGARGGHQERLEVHHGADQVNGDLDVVVQRRVGQEAVIDPRDVSDAHDAHEQHPSEDGVGRCSLTTRLHRTGTHTRRRVSEALARRTRRQRRVAQHEERRSQQARRTLCWVMWA